MTKYISIGRMTPDFETFKRDLVQQYDYRCQCMITAKGRKIGQCHVRITPDVAELDHCLIRKSKKHREWINAQPWNWQPSCHGCNNSKMTDRRTNRRYWLGIVVAVFGWDRIVADMQEAPEKMQEFNSDWNEVWGWLMELKGEIE